MLLSILICCRIFHRFLCKGYARRIRLSFVGMSKEKKRGLADERASERESERAKERTNKTLLVWEHCSVATTRHGRMSSRVVGADTIESYALNFSPRAYRESKLKVPRLLWLRDSWETKSLTELETFRVCQNFTFYPPNYSKIFVRALFFFFFFSFKSVLPFAFIFACIPGEINVLRQSGYIIVVIVSKKLGALRKGNVERLSWAARISSLGEITR